MPQSLANILVHLVFSTKERTPMLDHIWRADLHDYIGGILRRCGSDRLAVNSVADHVHLLFAMPRTMAVADLVKEIKTGTTKWIREKAPHLARFHWQAGYGIFSVSPGHKASVIQYIARQEEHHRRISFQDEYRRLLAKYNINYDERYVWD